MTRKQIFEVQEEEEKEEKEQDEKQKEEKEEEEKEEEEEFEKNLKIPELIFTIDISNFPSIIVSTV